TFSLGGLLFMMCTVLHHFFELTSVIHRVLWRRPNARDAKFTTAAFFVWVRAIHFSPCMTPSHFNAPPILLNEIQNLLNVLFGMYRSTHLLLQA
ncbi:hypothetical protein, partial [Hafnia paralvei]